MQKPIKNKIVSVEGGVYSDVTGIMRKKKVTCIITNDKLGKTLSINDGFTQFTIPIKPIERYLK